VVEIDPASLPPLESTGHWTTDLLKQRIVAVMAEPRLQAHLQHPYFGHIAGKPVTATPTELAQLTQVAQWKRRNKYRVDHGILRVFEFVPFGGDLGAFIVTDPADRGLVSFAFYPLD
jgi:hypothetical protein